MLKTMCLAVVLGLVASLIQALLNMDAGHFAIGMVCWLWADRLLNQR